MSKLQPVVNPENKLSTTPFFLPCVEIVRRCNETEWHVITALVGPLQFVLKTGHQLSSSSSFHQNTGFSILAVLVVAQAGVEVGGSAPLHSLILAAYPVCHLNEGQGLDKPLMLRKQWQANLFP